VVPVLVVIACTLCRAVSLAVVRLECQLLARTRQHHPGGPDVPTYQYACTECNHAFEQFQSFSEDSLTECPRCQGRLRKLFNAVGVVFKGSGFYRTDSRSGSSSAEGASSSETSSSTTSDSTSTKTEPKAKTETKTPAASSAASSD
jgi:putative FmdB family regulatory protein